MRTTKAFTLIEMSAVIVILLILIGISLPLVNKSGSAHEAKLSANAIYSILSLCDSMSRASGKVYMVDLNVNFSSTIIDPVKSPASVYRPRFNLIQIYCSTWDSNLNKVNNQQVGESYEIPYTLAALYNINSGENDKIYFKPDGEPYYEPGGDPERRIVVYPEKKPQLYYKIDLSTMKIISYK
ncbi:MAG: prepilin-type N-terminal cleavage/methylation domain-containing protein [Candidatus Aureabacteria bacterium]|nr:prepilin-type N-terminal cleavage/methylation domain-containing protein [Candidatus Auribacterota bacterium]